MNLKSMGLSALAVVQSARAFSLSSRPLAVSTVRCRQVSRGRCRHTAAAAGRGGGVKRHVTRMEAGEKAGPSSPVLGRGREVGGVGSTPRRFMKSRGACSADGKRQDVKSVHRPPKLAPAVGPSKFRQFLSQAHLVRMPVVTGKRPRRLHEQRQKKVPSRDRL